MKLLRLLFLLPVLLVVNATAATSSEPPTKALAAAKAITTITGVAISPLLGTGAVGAWDWWQAKTPEQKAKLPWYANPWFWLPALGLAGAVAFKDVAGAATPPGLKKPLDVAETIENKVSGLVAAGAVVPMIAAFIPMTTGSGGQAGAESAFLIAGIGGFNFSGLLNIFTVPLAMIAFVLVWLAAHAINVLILLSPWGGLDLALKSFRTFLLGTVTVTHFVNPMAGLVLSLIIIILAYFLAGWSLRLTFFGSVFVWDFISGRRKRFKPAPDANWMFTARKLGKTPIRTYGKLSRAAAGEFTFTFRPWLIGKIQTITLPAGDYAVGRGLFYPELMRIEREADTVKEFTTLLMPPRYRTHEAEIAQIYRLNQVIDVGLLRGFKAIWNWLKGFFGGRDATPVTVPA